jgi:hypothetical protein
LDFLIKVKDRFPELQWEWLIKNEGEMLVSEKMEVEKEKIPTTSLPDLFTMIDDEIFGQTESEDTIKIERPQELNITIPKESKPQINDSQRLESKEIFNNSYSTDNEEIKVKRIVIFYENGKFESFEP